VLFFVQLLLNASWWCLVPLAAWVAFAGVLNASVLALNG